MGRVTQQNAASAEQSSSAAGEGRRAGPMYASTATLVTVVQALLAKGAALGTALAFMMAVVGLSLPEFVLLRRVLCRRRCFSAPE
jgi:hypothetical protein